MRSLACIAALALVLLAAGCTGIASVPAPSTGPPANVPTPMISIDGAMSVTPGQTGLPLSVDSYEADYALNGSLLEHYLYRVEAPGTYRMLYRTFDAPLVFAPTDSPHIELVAIQPLDGAIAYAREASGTVRLSDPAVGPETASFVATQAGVNEVGLVDIRTFSSGTYDAWYSFVVRPPVEYDASFVHVNLKLADAHVPYSSIRITVPADRVNEVFAYPSTLLQTREGDRIVITGSAGQDETVGIELLLDPSVLDTIAGFPQEVDDVGNRTRSAYSRERALRQI